MWLAEQGLLGLDDPVPAIRVEALHALACDRCKDDGCRPAPHDLLPKAIELVTSQYAAVGAAAGRPGSRPALNGAAC